MTDATVERVVANLLRAGVFISAAVVLAGGLCYMVQHGQQIPQYRAFHGASPEYRTLPAIVKGAFSGDCLAVIQLGLLLLIATPVARVAFALAAFILEKDRVYVAVTTIVLAVLLYGLFGDR